jgi:TPP-dependent indolepyruvate ferredoxin oxidoreductase alpha subunit
MKMNKHSKSDNKNQKERREFWQGNYAVAEGAIAAGCRFYAGYPITPSSEIFHNLSRMLPKLDRHKSDDRHFWSWFFFNAGEHRLCDND